MLKKLIGDLFGKPSGLRALWRRSRFASGVVPRSNDGPHARLEEGIAYQQNGRYAEAEAAYRAVLQAAPEDLEGLHLLGSALQLQGKLDEAASVLQKLVSLNPGIPEAHFSLGCILHAQGRFAGAAEKFATALELRPDFAEACSNRGNALKALGRTDDAEDCYRQALQLRPEFAEAHYNLGNVLHEQGRLDEAVTAYRAALRTRPDFSDAHSNLVYALNFLPRYDPESIFKAHLEWGAAHGDPLRKFMQPHANPCGEGRPVRIGYVSPNFRNHAVAYFFEPVLTHHDRDRFAIVCYSDVVRPDEVTRRLRRYQSTWRDIAGRADEEVADMIRADAIDILVDLSGHTDHNRLSLFARKPAPVQVTWNGYANTTGLSTIDYRVTDAFADPPGMTERYHTEKLVRLPEIYMCIQPPVDAPAVNHLPALESRHLTFGSFNAASKITSQVVALWARILKAVPGSRLIMAAVSPGRAQRRILDLFSHEEIERDRLELHGRLPFSEFLYLHHRADIALDPFPFHGTTTTCHTLWMGLPVITLAGATHVSRVGVSFLSNVGLSDLIAQSPDDYIRIATGLAGDLERLQKLRDGLRQRMIDSPLTDAPRLTRHLEQAYLGMWKNWCSRNH